MPVVTFDLVFGTSKLEKLNLSHNVIADIRKGKFANLKQESCFGSFFVRLFICVKADIGANPGGFRKGEINQALLGSSVMDLTFLIDLFFFLFYCGCLQLM